MNKNKASYLPAEIHPGGKYIPPAIRFGLNESAHRRGQEIRPGYRARSIQKLHGQTFSPSRVGAYPFSSGGIR